MLTTASCASSTAAAAASTLSARRSASVSYLLESFDVSAGFALGSCINDVMFLLEVCRAGDVAVLRTLVKKYGKDRVHRGMVGEESGRVAEINVRSAESQIILDAASRIGLPSEERFITFPAGIAGGTFATIAPALAFINSRATKTSRIFLSWY